MGKARIKCERIDQKMNKEMTSKFFEALTDLEKENNIGSDILIEKIKSGIERLSRRIILTVRISEWISTLLQESSI